MTSSLMTMSSSSCKQSDNIRALKTEGCLLYTAHTYLGPE